MVMDLQKEGEADLANGLGDEEEVGGRPRRSRLGL